jgi:hypothetical protein
MSIEANVVARKAASDVCELINGELKTLIDRFGIDAVKPFFALLREVYGKNLEMLPAAAPAPVSLDRKRRSVIDECGDALELIDEALEIAERVPERGQEYAESVTSTLNGIAATIERTDKVTENQLAAIENIKSGLERWVE